MSAIKTEKTCLGSLRPAETRLASARLKAPNIDPTGRFVYRYFALLIYSFSDRSKRIRYFSLPMMLSGVPENDFCGYDVFVHYTVLNDFLAMMLLQCVIYKN